MNIIYIIVAKDEEYYPTTPRKSKKKPAFNFDFGRILEFIQNKKQVGAGLVGLGLLLTFLGMMLFFEGNLLRIGNVSDSNSFDQLCLCCTVKIAMSSNDDA